MNRDDVICIEIHPNWKIWSHLEKATWGAFFSPISGPTFGLGLGLVLGSKPAPKWIQHRILFRFLLFRAVGGSQVASGCHMGLSKVILKPWKARKWPLFACFEPSTYSLLGASSGPSCSVLIRFGLQNGPQK